MRKAIMFLVVLCLVIHIETALSQELFKSYYGYSTTEPLRGLESIVLDIDVDELAENDGLTAHKVKTDVELKLRMVGLDITPEKSQDSLADALLNVIISVNKDCQPLPYTYFVSVEFIQPVILVADWLRNINEKTAPAVGFASTWKFGVYGCAQSLTKIREEAKECVDNFVNAYLAVNPIERGVVTDSNNLGN